MKILHVAPSIARSYGGPARSLAGYAAAATASGIDVTVVAPSAPEPDVAEFESLLGASRVHTFSAAGRNAFTISPKLLAWVASQCSNFDVIHVHGLFNPVSDLSCRAALRRGVPVILRPFGTLSRYTFTHRRKLLKRLWFRALNRRNVQLAAALHFTTEQEQEQARWHGEEISDRAWVVPPPWTGGTPARGGASLAQPDSPRVLFIGRVNPIKNLECLLEAWPQVLASRPDATLVIAGTSGDAYSRALISRGEALRASVSFRPFVSDAERAELLSAASVFVLPSHHENFGIAALEAIAAGIPVVLSPHVQLGSFVEAHGLGIIAEATPPSLASAIIAAMGDDSLRTRVRSEGYSLVSRTFGVSAIGPQLSAMYLGAVKHARNRRIGALS